MKKRIFQIMPMFPLMFLLASNAWSHCEIPCGIYDDETRIRIMAEHITTVEKSMKKIMELGKKNPTNHNQLIRWVSNKEEHASALQEVITQYFMTQQIELDTKKYTEKLALLHKMLVYAMKCKQTTDVSYVDSLKSLLNQFETLYFQAN